MWPFNTVHSFYEDHVVTKIKMAPFPVFFIGFREIILEIVKCSCVL